MNAFFVIYIALAIRAIIALWDYSGKGTPPMFGDFEAQRHWMEITTSLPIGDWYVQTSDNDLQYWGLDYPPLTAYVSWVFGTIAKGFRPQIVQLYDSRGYEGEDGKFFMRTTVLIADFMVFIPSIIMSLYVMVSKELQSKLGDDYMLWYLLMISLLCPSSVLIDHGHFQYNGVCLGLALLGAVAISLDYDVMGSILFCLSLNFKQMSLYYAPVFFFALLRKCVDKGNKRQFTYHLVKIGSTVILSFIALWWPFCVYASEELTCASSLLQVLSRQFPFSRGIFEDKVANIWYSLSVVVDVRQYLSIPQLATVSLLLTLLLLVPTAVDLMRKPVTSVRFIIALVNSSLAFFLASFQVRR
jgi:alpha-1,3-glucosyltransferase